MTERPREAARPLPLTQGSGNLYLTRDPKGRTGGAAVACRPDYDWAEHHALCARHRFACAESENDAVKLRPESLKASLGQIFLQFKKLEATDFLERF
jgi:hypothetical protein